jgi:hypothetical protein
MPPRSLPVCMTRDLEIQALVSITCMYVRHAKTLEAQHAASLGVGAADRLHQLNTFIVAFARFLRS